jgi:hypothetical protein
MRVPMTIITIVDVTTATGMKNITGITGAAISINSPTAITLQRRRFNITNSRRRRQRSILSFRCIFAKDDWFQVELLYDFT